MQPHHGYQHCHSEFDEPQSLSVLHCWCTSFIFLCTGQKSQYETKREYSSRLEMCTFQSKQIQQLGNGNKRVWKWAIVEKWWVWSDLRQRHRFVGALLNRNNVRKRTDGTFARIWLLIFRNGASDVRVIWGGQWPSRGRDLWLTDDVTTGISTWPRSWLGIPHRVTSARKDAFN